MNKDISVQRVFEYHERTKHAPNRYARSPGYLDRENEPIPFRVYEGTKKIHLPLLDKDPDANYFCLYERGDNAQQSITLDAVASFLELSLQSITLDAVASFLELSLGLSAWKSFGNSRWALRMNPSSGNLHPTEAYLVLPPLPNFESRGGVFHYNPYLHALEQRTSFDENLWRMIKIHLGVDCFFVGLSSIHWREAWKYGERAFRYCHHDIGHALACLSFSANLLGWKVIWLNTLSDEDVKQILGFDRTTWKPSESEYPELLLLVHKNSDTPAQPGLTEEIISSFARLSYGGEPNRLSKEHKDWGVIDDAALHTAKPRTGVVTCIYNHHDYLEKVLPHKQEAAVIRQRRSAQMFDGSTSITKEVFFALLDKTIPRNNRAPFDVCLGEVSVNLLLFVHSVHGLEQGIYFLMRNERDFADIRSRCHAHFPWRRVKGTPGTLHLYLLEAGDFRQKAATISCHQEIAGDSAFSLGMISMFRENVEKSPYLYRTLFWETGMIGQVLYLEAEAHSVRGTGIGCFFDDLVHSLLGFKDKAYQSLYHFTVGGPVEDRRLTTLPPYHHIKQE